jgi:hypothetical protein
MTSTGPVHEAKRERLAACRLLETVWSGGEFLPELCRVPLTDACPRHTDLTGSGVVGVSKPGNRRLSRKWTPPGRNPRLRGVGVRTWHIGLPGFPWKFAGMGLFQQAIAGTVRMERAGIEPARHLSAPTRFPVALLRPLGHLSVRKRPQGNGRDAGTAPSAARLRLEEERYGTRSPGDPRARVLAAAGAATRRGCFAP